MWQPAKPTKHLTSDAQAFVRLLNQTPEAADLFDPAKPLWLSRAPGRLDVMGGIADYSGSLVLQMPIAEATFAAVQTNNRNEVRITSGGRHFACSLHDLCDIDYNQARAYFSRNPDNHWAAYAAGAIVVLTRKKDLLADQGVSILIHSAIPEGKGVSSSAAIEVAVMSAIAAAFNITVDPQQLAILCQIVENHIVGAPCGLMDQMTSSCGQQDQLMRLLCQPADLQGHVHLPPGLAVWGIDSGIRHAVSGSDYTSVRVGAFMGLRIITQQSGDNFGGYLANVGVPRYERDFADKLPQRISGKQFLDQYGPTSDTVTRVDPAREYAVRQPTAHPIYEHQRVNRFADLLKRCQEPFSEDLLSELGDLMYLSHASYSTCGLGSDGTDALVELVRSAGPASGLYGAKITGGGSGGTVAILGRSSAHPAVQSIAQQYAKQSGRTPYIFRGSSPGAAAFGVVQLSSAR